MVFDNTFSMNTISKLAYEKRFPHCVTIELLTACNYKCKHCYLPEHNSIGMKFEVIVDIFQQLRDMGTISLVLTGGEIFLRADIIEIIEIARNMGFRVTLLSNASLLNEDIINKLSKLYINLFSTTIFSLNEEINDKITCVKNSLAPILKNIFLMKEKGINIEVKTPIMKDNKFAYRELISFCEKNKFAYTPTTSITSKIDGDDSVTSLRLDYDDLEFVFNEIDYLLERNENTLSAFDKKSLPCPSIRNAMYIDSVGNVYPCNSLYYKVGNIYEHKVKDIWENSEEYKKLNLITNADLPKCCVCEMKDYCTRCPGHALLEDGNLFGCSSLDRCYAKIMMKRKKEK